MKPWLIWRALVLAVRHEGFLIATAVHLAALTAFVLIWGDGVPVWRGEPVLTQFVRFDTALLAAILPWVAIRCSPDAGPNGLTHLAVATACRPSSIVAARAAGTSGALLMLVSSGLPLFVLAQQISGLPASMVLRALLPMAALAVVVAAFAGAASVFLSGRLSSWIASTVATIVVVNTTSTTIPGVTAMVAVAALASIVMTTSADRRLRYLTETEQV